MRLLRLLSLLLALSFLSFAAGAEDGGSAVKEREERLAPYRTVGSTVTFGWYPQDGAGADEAPIEWTVLDVQGSRALLLSRYGLDVRPYHSTYITYTPVPWEKCALRKWLNEDFLNRAFTGDEQEAILLTDVDNSVGQGHWSTGGGVDTQDKLFLLSCAEAERYFGAAYHDNQNLRPRTVSTAYAAGKKSWPGNGNLTSDGAEAVYWWLRSPGFDVGYAAYIGPNGALGSGRVNSETVVRPALWLDLDADIF